MSAPHNRPDGFAYMAQQARDLRLFCDVSPQGRSRRPYLVVTAAAVVAAASFVPGAPALPGPELCQRHKPRCCHPFPHGIEKPCREAPS